MVGCIFFLLVIIPLQSSVVRGSIPCPDSPCPFGYDCCLPFGCWNKTWPGLGPQCSGLGPSCPLQKIVGNTSYERVENGVDTSPYTCTANCTYQKVEFSTTNEDVYCFKQPGDFPVTNNACEYPQILKEGETAGELCNRNCITNKENRTCAWTFTLQTLQTDYDGRRADGRLRNVTTYNGVIPGPGIVVCEGDTVVVRLLNRIQGTFEQLKGDSNGTTLHMHGIRRWNESYEDGVPGINQCELQSGENFKYRMTAKLESHENAPNGTYWYHSHVGSQRTNGAEGKLIIMPRNKPEDIDVDNATNTLFLQEWYISPNNNTPISILINGNGRVGPTIYTVPDDKLWDQHNYDYNMGRQIELKQVPNPFHIPNYFTTHYTEFDVLEGLRYRFRIIGGISQNFPLLVSVEDHNFSAIATDSIDFKPVADISGVWLAAGERYDIVIHTKTENIKATPYKIKVYGNPGKKSPLCTVAWLKYPGQQVDPAYFPPKDCAGFKSDGLNKILNPVTSTYIPKGPKYVFLNELRAKWQQPDIQQSFDTYYVDFINLSFNNFSMTYDDIPFLYQSPAKTEKRCGPNCTTTYENGFYNVTCDHDNLKTPPHCTPGDKCQCQHVNHQPHLPRSDGTKWWFETVLINPWNYDIRVAHPIHQHGGWYVVLAVEQFDFDFNLNRTWILKQDTEECTNEYCCKGENCCYEWGKGKHCLKRNYDHPIQKDTIQVPQNGYVILRTPVDNAGTWIFHCHINHHVESGMAMVLQIGGLDEQLPNQNWTLGPYGANKNVKCPIKLNTYQNPGRIDWFIGMQPIKACVKPGQNITFDWLEGHNVNKVSKETWENCRIGGILPLHAFTNTAREHGPHMEHFSDVGPHYFACGVGNSSHSSPGYGYHCKHFGLKAKVTVTNDMEACLHHMEEDE